MKFSHKDEDVRPEELVRVTEQEARENTDHLKNIPVTEKNLSKFNPERRKLPKGIVWALFGLGIFFIAGFVFSLYVIRSRVTNSIANRADALAQGVQDLKNLDPQSAAVAFSALGISSSSDLGGLMNIVGLLYKGSGDTLSALTDISNKLSGFSSQLTDLEKNAFGFFFTGQGGGLIASLNTTKDLLTGIDADSNVLSGALSSVGSPAIGSDSYLLIKAKMGETLKFLNVFLPWFANAEPRHILLLFENPSEMRPGGGFLGSYADVALAGGNVQNVTVHDIADVDLAFKGRIIPPQPLQLEVNGLRPADGNWFFDFPTTASETLGLFEASNLYAQASSGPVTFDGVIALTPNVVSNLLSITGPVTVGKPSTTFTADNLTVQVQKIVQAGQAQSATYPKAVLGNLATAIFTKLASSTDDDRQKLLSMALDWIANKDAMIYFKDPSLESFVGSNGASGAAYELPQNFNGTYLAIANADINSDKSELYVAQDVNLDAVLNQDGTETDHLVITRTHNGNKSPYWWYKTTSQDYLQIFVPLGSSLDNASGGISKKIYPPIDYVKNGYTTDPLVVAIESSTRPFFNYPNILSHTEAGKEVFSTWVRTYAGKSTLTSFDYTHHLFTPPTDGQKYQFVFDKQPGATGHYHFEINAPLGYKFVENNLPSYEYDSTSTPGQVIINLTLARI